MVSGKSPHSRVRSETRANAARDSEIRPGALPEFPPKIRAASNDDMAAIRELIRLFPQHLVQRNLPRAPSFFVADAGGRLVGCCALQVYSKRLAEVRSLAVHPDFQDRGLASDLVERCTQRARERGVRELFAVTSQTSFFARLGFATFRREKTAMFLELTPRTSN